MALTALSSLVVSRRVPAPYMDEIFHAPQTQRLCSAATPGDPLAGLRGANWDAKITTFPGLYLLGGAYAWLQAWMLRLAGGKQPATNAGSPSAAAAELLCGEVAALRGLNCLLLALCLFPAFSVRLRVLQRSKKGRRRGIASADDVPPQQNQQQQREQLQQQDALGTALAAAVLLPTHFFYGFVYYTDVGALLFLLLSASALQDWAEAHEVSGNAVPAALAAAAAGGAAVLMRQTNAVWYAFLVGAALLRVAYALVERHEAARGAGVLLPLRALAAIGRHARRQGTPLFAAQLALLSAPPFLFAAYVALINQGRVALGDHDAHDAAATRHWAHPFYAAAFCALASGSAFFVRRASAARLLARIWSRRCVAATDDNAVNKSAARRRRQPLSSYAPPLVAALVVLAAALLAAHHGTVAHPYLLADNRHYTFYVWRRTLGKHWLVKYAFAPVGAACCLLLASELAAGVVGGGEEEDEAEEEQQQEQEQEGWLWVLGFALACAATLVPAGLIEPRYYTVPAVLALLHAPARLFERRRRSKVEEAGEASSSPSAAAFDWSALVACLSFSAVNAATLYVFAYRPFTWPDGSTARFMW